MSFPQPPHRVLLPALCWAISVLRRASLLSRTALVLTTWLPPAASFSRLSPRVLLQGAFRCKRYHLHPDSRSCRCNPFFSVPGISPPRAFATCSFLHAPYWPWPGAFLGSPLSLAKRLGSTAFGHGVAIPPGASLPSRALSQVSCLDTSAWPFCPDRACAVLVCTSQYRVLPRALRFLALPPPLARTQPIFFSVALCSRALLLTRRARCLYSVLRRCHRSFRFTWGQLTLLSGGRLSSFLQHSILTAAALLGPFDIHRPPGSAFLRRCRFDFFLPYAHPLHQAL